MSCRRFSCGARRLHDVTCSICRHNAQHAVTRAHEAVTPAASCPLSSAPFTPLSHSLSSRSRCRHPPLNFTVPQFYINSVDLQAVSDFLAPSHPALPSCQPISSFRACFPDALHGFSRLHAPIPHRAIAAAPAKAKKTAPRKGGTAKDISASTSGLLFPGCGAMMLCRVALGRLAPGNSGLRKPPDGADAVFSGAWGGRGAAGGGGGGGAKDLWDVGAVGEQNIFAVFDNAQAYPEYIVHIK